MEKNPSSDSQFIHHPKSPPQLLSHTTPFSPLTPSWSTLMSQSSSITKPSMISAEEISISRDQPTPTWTDSFPKSSPPWLPLWDSTEPWTSTSLSSRPTWSHIPESTSCYHHTPPSSQPRKPTTNNSQLLKSPTAASSQPTWWPSATQDTVNIWLAPWCTEETLSQKTSTQRLPPSRPREPFNSLTGAPLDSKSESTISHQQLSPEVTSLKWWEHAAWSQIPQPLPKSSADSTTSSIWCTPREPLSIGTSEKVWKKESSPKPEKIWLPLKRITKRSESKLLRDKDKKKAD